MKDRIKNIFQESINIKNQIIENQTEVISSAAQAIIETIQKGHKVFLFGNGGSAADSQHMAAEFIGRFQKERKSFPAIALTTDTSILTSLGNDYGFEAIFARQVEGLGQTGDIAIGFSTSGKSKNIVSGIKKAKELGLKTISLTGCGGGEIASLTDISIVVPSKVTARIQEAHSIIIHCLCELVEESFS